MAEVNYYALMLANPHAAKPTAQLDVAIDTVAGTGLPVTFGLFNASGQAIPIAAAGGQTTFNVQTGPNGFASSAQAAPPVPANLLTISGNQTALVKASVALPPGVAVANAVLRQKGVGAKLAIGVPPSVNASGAALSGGAQMDVAVGDLMAATTLYIANVSSGPIDISVCAGSTVGGTVLASVPQLGAYAFTQVAVTSANSNIVVATTTPGGCFIVQLAIDDGTKLDEATLLPC